MKKIIKLRYYKLWASLCKSRRHIPDIDLIYRPDFLLETITQLIKQLIF